jgi:anti-sigma28 factor (negative regulator of flagellin synthesis)
MNINNQSHLAGDRHRLSQESTRTQSVAQGVDPVKHASVAQATVKAVQEALARISPTQGSSQPSAQLSIESAKIARSTSTEKVGNDDDLDITRLDELKAKIADGSFEIDFGLLARQLVEHSVQQSSSKRGK